MIFIEDILKTFENKFFGIYGYIPQDGRLPGKSFLLKDIILRSISSTIFEQLLRVQIPKAQKDSQVISLFALLGYLCEKAAHKMLMKLTKGVNFIYILCTRFSYKSALRSFL